MRLSNKRVRLERGEYWWFKGVVRVYMMFVMLTSKFHHIFSLTGVGESTRLELGADLLFFFFFLLLLSPLASSRVLFASATMVFPGFPRRIHVISRSCCFTNSGLSVAPRILEGNGDVVRSKA